MSPASLIALSAFSIQAPMEQPAVVLAASSDTGFVLVLDSVSTSGPHWRGKMIEVFARGSEPYDTIRRESDLAIDCQARRFRTYEVTKTTVSGDIKREDSSNDWHELGTGFPPFAALYAIACTGLTVDEHARPLTEIEPAIRASLAPY